MTNYACKQVLACVLRNTDHVERSIATKLTRVDDAVEALYAYILPEGGKYKPV